MLSFHQRFYRPHWNSRSVRKHLNFVKWTLIRTKRFWLAAWILVERLFLVEPIFRKKNIRVLGPFLYWGFCGIQGETISNKEKETFLQPTLLLGILWGPNISQLFPFMSICHPTKLSNIWLEKNAGIFFRGFRHWKKNNNKMPMLSYHTQTQGFYKCVPNRSCKRLPPLKQTMPK